VRIKVVCPNWSGTTSVVLLGDALQYIKLLAQDACPYNRDGQADIIMLLFGPGYFAIGLQISRRGHLHACARVSIKYCQKKIYSDIWLFLTGVVFFRF